MNWDALGSVAELIGSIAVLITVVYLAIQIRHSTNVSKIEAYRDVQQRWSVLRERTSEPETSALIAKGLPGLANLNDHERQRFLKLMGDEFSFLDSVMLMDRKGLFDKEYRVLENFSGFYKNFLKYPGVMEFWATIKDGTSPFLVDWVNENVDA